MAVLINFKICDNAPECNGIAECPTGALTWDEENETIVIDNDKCTSCGICEKVCPMGVISVTHSEEEYKRKKEEIDNDPRTVKDLFSDRYGATPLAEYFMIEEDELDSKISEGLRLIEFYNDDSIQCLLKSIPIKDITENLPSDLRFYKLSVDDQLMNKYNVKELPSLLIFKDGNLLDKIEGYYTTDQKEEFMDKINEIIK